MYLFFKRFFDILLGFIGFIFLIPMSIMVKIGYILIKDYNSIFYTQERIGKNGKPFTIYKFRTMIINSQEVLDELLKNPDIKAEYESSYKIKNDPRITKVGKILRKTSLDEMPQFINLIIGNMSLVGPRPVIKKELKKYKHRKKLILSVKPGITGNWVIHGRSDLTYEERIEYEVEYIKNRSLLCDFKIILKTILCVIKRRGVV